MQIQDSKEETEDEDAITKILESRDIHKGVDATVKEVNIETKLRAVEHLKGEFRKEGQNLLAIDRVLNRERVDEYLDEDTIKTSMQSPFVHSEIVDSSFSRNHLNRNTAKTDGEVFVHKNPTYNPSKNPEINEFYRCAVEHTVEVTLEDGWESERELSTTFQDYESARSFHEHLESISGNQVELSHDGAQYYLELDESSSDSDTRENNTFLNFYRSIVIGGTIGLIGGFLGFGFLPIFLATSLIICLDFWNAHQSKSSNIVFYLSPDSKHDRVLNGFNIEDLEDYSIMENFEDTISIHIQDDMVKLTADNADAKWLIGTIPGRLPNSTAIEFFEDVGLENIENDTFEAIVEKRSTLPSQSCLQSTCGNWYLYPKQDEI